MEKPTCSKPTNTNKDLDPFDATIVYAITRQNNEMHHYIHIHITSRIRELTEY